MCKNQKQSHEMFTALCKNGLKLVDGCFCDAYIKKQINVRVSCQLTGIETNLSVKGQDVQVRQRRAVVLFESEECARENVCVVRERWEKEVQHKFMRLPGTHALSGAP